MEKGKQKMISVLLKSSEWDEDEKEKWSKFRDWVEANGGKWRESMGMHQIFFEPIEES